MIVEALYNLIMLLFAPVIVTVTALRHIRRGRAREGWSERLGRLPASLVDLCRGREVIWVHAVSVGETAAARPLIAELRRRRPRAVILLSQITETGREAARSAVADHLFYLPVDVPWAVRRVLDQLRPRLLVTIDTELWPNLIWNAHRRGVKVALANGRISDRSLKRIRRVRAQWLYRGLLPGLDRLLMQSELDADRVRHLGAAESQVSVVGNLKGDEAFPEVDAARLAWWRETLGLGEDSPVLVAGSTGPGEEAILLEAFCRVLAEHGRARLILVPRAVDRAGEIEGLVTQRGLTAVRRSRLPEQAPMSRERRAVVIVDTIGELAELFAVGDVTFVGRSLVPMGGSNVLQAGAQGKPVLTGPYVNNVRDSVALLADAGVCRTVDNADELAAAALAWLGDPAELRRVGERARQVVLANRGATARTVDALLELLDARA
jgi:3-deoxy-D-manno-octulosonic-acid transferase